LKLTAPAINHNTYFYLFLTTSSPAAEVVAAKPVVAAPKSFIDKIWNEDTKLTAYLAVWYLGKSVFQVLLLCIYF
jgi:hypothetical protein